MSFSSARRLFSTARLRLSRSFPLRPVAAVLAASTALAASVAWQHTQGQAAAAQQETNTNNQQKKKDVNKLPGECDRCGNPSVDSLSSGVNIDLHRLIDPRPPNLHLRSVLFVTRHGSRTPMSYLPHQSKADFQAIWGQCPLGDHTTIPCERGLLTAFGEFQLSSVGWHLRQRYVHGDEFFPSTFDPAFFQLRSTDLPRTQLSLARAVQGLYPGLSIDAVAPRVEVRKQALETLYPNHYHCARLKELYVESCHATRQAEPEKYPEARAYAQLADSAPATALREQFARALSTPAEKLGTWVVISDELKCRQAVGMSQVAGVSSSMVSGANALAEQTFWHILRGGADGEHSARKPSCKSSSDLLYTDKSEREAEVVRLGMGRLLGEIFGQFDQIKLEEEEKKGTATAATSTPSPRAFLYSGHDTTLAPLLAALHSSYALSRPSSSSSSSSSSSPSAAATCTNANCINHPQHSSSLPSPSPSSFSSAGPGWPALGGNVLLELLEKSPQEEQHQHASATQVSQTKRSMSQNLAPMPPTTLDDEEHHLPVQMEGGKQVELRGNNKKKSSSNTNTRAPFVASPDARWFIRLLVDHREVSIIPYDEYKYIRQNYEVKDWIAECAQKSTEKIPNHQW